MCVLSAEFQPGLNVAVKGRVLPFFSKESVYEVFVVSIWALSFGCEVFGLALPVIALVFHGVPPASVPVVACFPGGVSSVSVGVTQSTVEVAEVTVKQHVDGVWNEVLTTDTVNSFDRIDEVLVVSWLCLSVDDLADSAMFPCAEFVEKGRR